MFRLFVASSLLFLASCSTSFEPGCYGPDKGIKSAQADVYKLDGESEVLSSRTFMYYNPSGKMDSMIVQDAEGLVINSTINQFDDEQRLLKAIVEDEGGKLEKIATDWDDNHAVLALDLGEGEKTKYVYDQCRIQEKTNLTNDKITYKAIFTWKDDKLKEIKGFYSEESLNAGKPDNHVLFDQYKTDDKGFWIERSLSINGEAFKEVRILEYH